MWVSHCVVVRDVCWCFLGQPVYFFWPLHQLVSVFGTASSFPASFASVFCFQGGAIFGGTRWSVLVSQRGLRGVPFFSGTSWSLFVNQSFLVMIFRKQILLRVTELSLVVSSSFVWSAPHIFCLDSTIVPNDCVCMMSSNSMEPIGVSCVWAPGNFQCQDWCVCLCVEFCLNKLQIAFV